MSSHSCPIEGERKQVKSTADDPNLTPLERALAKALISVLLKEIRSVGPHLVRKLVA
jgi:hypothetical protein